MNFDLTDEQELLRDSVIRMLADNYSFEQRTAMRAKVDGFDRAMWQRFADLGLLALPFAEADGGLGGGAVDVMLLMESFGRHLVLEPYLASVVLAGGCLRHAASPQQREEMLPPLLSGETRWAFAHVERAARYDLSRIDTRARRDGDRWVLEGAKTQVLHGDSADKLIVSARAEDDSVALFVVETNSAGLTRRGYPTQDGLRAAEVKLQGVVVAESCRLSAADGLATVRRVFDEATAAICAEAVGTMDRALEITVDYLKQRKQFGVTISSFQALQHRAVDMLVMVEQARSMACYATMMLADPDPARRSAAVSAAKVQISKSARHVGEQSVQLHGGIGVTEECAIGHYYRRLTMIDILFGDSHHHLGKLAAAGAILVD